MSFTPIGDAIDSKKKSDGSLQSQVETARVLEAAEAAFTELFAADLARHAKPQYLKNRTLTVTCTSSALAQEIRLNQGQIVESINKRLGGKEVDRIRYLA